jgi:hypothetical protein
MIEYRWAAGQADRLTEMAADLVRRNVAVIATPLSTQAGSATTGQFRRFVPRRRPIWCSQYQLESYARDVARVKEHGHRVVCRGITNLFH